MLVLPHQESDLRLFEATRRLRINTRTLQFLIKDGYLRVYKAANPNTKTFRHYIKVDDVRKFERNFSTLGSLHDEFGQISHGGICAKIRVLGIHPIYAKDGISTIYHRKDAERAIRNYRSKEYEYPLSTTWNAGWWCGSFHRPEPELSFSSFALSASSIIRSISTSRMSWSCKAANKIKDFAASWPI